MFCSVVVSSFMEDNSVLKLLSTSYGLAVMAHTHDDNNDDAAY